MYKDVIAIQEYKQQKANKKNKEWNNINEIKRVLKWKREDKNQKKCHNLVLRLFDGKNTSKSRIKNVLKISGISSYKILRGEW